MVSEEEKIELTELAEEARTQAYNEYSDYGVGAAVLTTDGDVYTGCNVENINYSQTVHAEETALVCAISDGVKRDEFQALAISAKIKDDCPPCGSCRQTISELCPPDMPVLINLGNDGYSEYTIQELLPKSMREIIGDLDQ